MSLKSLMEEIERHVGCGPFLIVFCLPAMGLLFMLAVIVIVAIVDPSLLRELLVGKK